MCSSVAFAPAPLWLRPRNSLWAAEMSWPASLSAPAVGSKASGAGSNETGNYAVTKTVVVV